MNQKETLLNKRKEAFAKKKGYKKYHGYKIDTSDLEEGTIYIAKENFADIFEECTFWQLDDSEMVWEDVDEVIDAIEDDDPTVKFEGD